MFKGLQDGWDYWAFNRTSMELKQTLHRRGRMPNLTFNRTSMELKHRTFAVRHRRHQAFNRTSMELKRVQGYQYPLQYPFLLIEPVWN